jgi:sugar phosphate isomerase/epimerase
MVEYGQKLFIEDLEDCGIHAKYATPVTLLGLLHDLGIRFIEFPVVESTPPELILKYASLCRDLDLYVSIHPHFNQNLSPEIFNKSSHETLKRFLTVIQHISDLTLVPVKLVFHGGRAGFEPYFIDYKQALQNARSFFQYIDDLCTGTFTEVIPICETQTPWNESVSGIVRLGDTWQTCLELLENTDLGVCWDFGHTFRAARLNKHSMIPNEAFMARVQHVHAHDTLAFENGLEDHHPLGDGLAPWRQNCAELCRYSYDETILLEVNLSTYGNLDTMKNLIEDSIDRLSVFFGSHIKEDEV